METWGKQAPGSRSGKCKGPEAQVSLGQGSRKETTVVGIKGENGPPPGVSIF